MFKKSLLFTTLTLFSFTLFQGCSDAPEGATESVVASNEFTLTAIDGATTYTVTKEADTYTLQGHENKIVLFDIFATWCQPCRAEAPHLASLQKKYPSELTVLGVTIEEGISNEKLLAFKNENNADFIIVNSEVNKPFYRSIASSINIGQQFPIPLMVMYKDGKYVTHYVGMVAEEMIESDIQMALGK